MGEMVKTHDEVDGCQTRTESSYTTDFSSRRDNHVRKLMGKNEHKYLTLEKLRLFVGTWNVNGKTASEDLAPWLRNAVGRPPDLIVLGFQELDLSKEALVFADSIREPEWRAACEKAVNKLNPDVKYDTVQVVRLVGVMLILFASQSISVHVDNVATGTVPTGIMGFMGNKGGVSIRLIVHSTPICFVTSHLAAHVEQKERRNQDYRDINDRMTFSGTLIDINSNNISISTHDLIFWLGDLNYRITEIPIEKVKLLIKDRNWQPLLDRDQLIAEKKVKNAFENFQESTIDFPPSYKYDVNTDEYDTSEKARCPAWTDRILYKGKHITPLTYDSHMELRLSDHKPVSQIFDIGVKVIDKEKYRNYYEEVMKECDKLENENLPQVTLSTTELNFGEVRFLEPRYVTLDIQNTGLVAADFSFIPKLNELVYCKKWLVAKPNTGCILPNEVATVNLTVHVDEKSAAQLSTGQDCIDDILVLHLQGGKDFFLTVSGNYTFSSFGCSLETLIQLPQAVRDAPRQQIIDMVPSALTAVWEVNYTEQHHNPLIHSLPDFVRGIAGGYEENGKNVLDVGENSTMPVPKELFFLLDNISKKGKDVRDLFQQRGLHSEIVEIREVLDTSLTEDLPGSIHSIAEALLLFLSSLREPVIPYRLYDDALSAANNRQASIGVISKLPSVHKKVFEYLVEFMLELLTFSDDNYLDANTLGNVFGSALIRTDSDRTHTKADHQLLEQRKAMFVSNFLHGTAT